MFILPYNDFCASHYDTDRRRAEALAHALAGLTQIARDDAGVVRRGFAEGGVVRWIDTGRRSVMLIEDDGKTGATLIWLLDNSIEGASRGDSHERA